MPADKPPEDALSLFQKAMSETNTSKRNYNKHQVNLYDQRDKPQATRPTAQHVSTEAPNPAAIDKTDQAIQGEPALFVRPGLQRKIVKRLKRGDYPYQDVLDLHGMRFRDAETSLDQFLSQAIRHNYTCVLIIHGKGHRSENNISVLKPLTIKQLKATAEIKAFCSAHPKDGGTGAIYALLKNN